MPSAQGKANGSGSNPAGTACAPGTSGLSGPNSRRAASSGGSTRSGAASCGSAGRTPSAPGPKRRRASFST